MNFKTLYCSSGGVCFRTNENILNKTIIEGFFLQQKTFLTVFCLTPIWINLETVQLCQKGKESHLFNISDSVVQLSARNVYLETPAGLRLHSRGSEYSRSCERKIHWTRLTNCQASGTRWKSMFSRMRASGCWSSGAEWITLGFQVELCWWIYVGLWAHILSL